MIPHDTILSAGQQVALHSAIAIIVTPSTGSSQLISLDSNLTFADRGDLNLIEPKEQIEKRCLYKWRQSHAHYRNTIHICNRIATHETKGGSPVCHKHFNKTKDGTISVNAWKHTKSMEKLERLKKLSTI